MTDTSKELVKRLRAVNHMCVEDCFLQSPLFGHAADAIEALQARADAAESEAHACGAEREKWKERAEAAEAKSGNRRTCLSCGRTAGADHGQSMPMPDCNFPGHCSFSLTAEEAWQHWRRVSDDHLSRAEAAEAELAEARHEGYEKGVKAAAGICQDMDLGEGTNPWAWPERLAEAILALLDTPAPSAPLPDKGKMVRPKPGARCGGYPPPSGRAYTPGPRQAVAEYPAQPSPEAVVKAALEWVQIGDNFWVARAPFFGTFRVESYGHGWAASWSVPGFSDAFVDGRFESAEDAIAAINVKVAATLAQIIAQAGKGARDGN